VREEREKKERDRGKMELGARRKWVAGGLEVIVREYQSYNV
jgi:hypothetical protein